MSSRVTSSSNSSERSATIFSDNRMKLKLQVRSTGVTPSDTDVIRVAKLFHDDITLDNLSRPQLVSMCKYIGVNAFGTDNILKHQIRSKLERVRVDDMVSFRSRPC